MLFLKRNDDYLAKTDDRTHEAGPKRIDLKFINKISFSFHI